LVESDVTDCQRNAKKSIERRESCIDEIDVVSKDGDRVSVVLRNAN